MHAELLLNQKRMHHFFPLDNRDHADPLLGYKRVHGSLLSCKGSQEHVQEGKQEAPATAGT